MFSLIFLQSNLFHKIMHSWFLDHALSYLQWRHDMISLPKPSTAWRIWSGCRRPLQWSVPSLKSGGWRSKGSCNKKDCSLLPHLRYCYGSALMQTVHTSVIENRSKKFDSEFWLQRFIPDWFLFGQSAVELADIYALLKQDSQRSKLFRRWAISAARAVL